VEIIGKYGPREEPPLVDIDNDKALAWLQKGAQPTEQVQRLLTISGAWEQHMAAKAK
jgi:small subunit ribosomal protein S16